MWAASWTHEVASRERLATSTKPRGGAPKWPTAAVFYLSHEDDPSADYPESFAAADVKLRPPHGPR